ncbi:MAG: ester cyclase [Chloroflexi bacterium]|nr:ester cyclase [Chloroflexota bacterium]MCC6891735.1 ester cyclase [Anaerolineae bacterium]
MSAEDNKAIVRDWLDARNAHDVEAAMKFWAVHRQNDIRDAFNGFTRTFPDLSITILDMIAEGDKVACLRELHGTHLGSFGKISATGHKISWRAMDLYTITDEKISDIIRMGDNLDLLQQLGVSVS